VETPSAEPHGTSDPADLTYLAGLMAHDWAAAMLPVAGQIRSMGAFLRAELAAGRGYLPAGPDVFRAFARPLDRVRVLVVGQDPYPTPGHPMGLSFSVQQQVHPLPRSLANIFTELEADVGAPGPQCGDLSGWADQGVMLLNRVLTVSPGAPASHRGKGWEQVTQRAIEALVARGGPLAAILWGRDAQSLAPMLGSTPVVSSVHPSPLSAHRGFFGSRPFSRVNDLLVAQGAEPVDWRLL
jgi:uracil-DNA glycosylase